MTKKQSDPNEAILPAALVQTLRQRAEATFRATEAHTPARLSPDDTQRVLHELQVHQIELELQNEELRRAQVELEKSRARYFNLYDLAPVGYVTLSEQGLILEANLTAAGLLGVARGALVKQPLTHFILPDDQDIYYQHHKHLLETGTPQACELRLARADSVSFWAELAMTATPDAPGAQDTDGTPVYRTVLSDITERKEAEEARRDSEARFQALFEQAAVGVAQVHTATGKFVRVNQKYCAIAGYPRQTLEQLDIQTITHPEDLPANLENLERLKAGEIQDFTLEKRYVRQDGSSVWVSLTVSPLGPAGTPPDFYISVVQDITARKQLETALQASERKLKTLFELLPVGVAVLDAEHRLAYMNPALETIWAMTPEDVGSGGYQRRTYLRPDGTPLPPEELASERALREQRVVRNVEVAVALPTGQIISTNVSAAPIALPDGQIVMVVDDITARVRSEHERQQAEDKIRQLNAELEQRITERTRDLQQANALLQAEIVERRQAEMQLRLQIAALQAAANSIVITDPQGNIVWSNPAFTTLTGYTADEALGQTPRLVRSGQHSPTFYEQMWQTILAGQVWHGELVNRRKDGALYIEEQTITPVRGETGHLSHFIAIKQDVTQRKLAEESLRQNEALLEKVFASVDLLIAYLDRDFNFIRVNRAYAEAGRHAPEYFAGKNLFALFPAAENEALFRRVVETGKAYSAFEKPFELVAPEGLAPRYLDWSLQPLADAAGSVQGLVFSLVDVTQRKQAEDRLRWNALRSQAIAEISQALVEAQFDDHAVIEVVTERLADLFNDACLIVLYSQDNQLLTAEALHHPDPIIEAKLRQRLSVTPPNSEAGHIARHILQTNQPLLIPVISSALGQAWFSPDNQVAAEQVGLQSLLAVPLHTHERMIGQLLLLRLRPEAPYSAEDQLMVQNLADRAALAITNAQLYRDLENALAQEQTIRQQLVQAEKLGALGRMVSSVAHELNNPLQTITNCLYLTHEELSDDSPIHTYLEMADSETQRLVRLVAQLRELYRPRTVSPETHDLAQLLQNVQALMARQLQSGHVEWLQPADLPGYSVTIVSDHLTQVFINVVTNAIEAMQPGGGQLLVDVAPAADGRQVGVSFKDTGPGIQAELLSRLFEPFFTTKSQGLGLGLAICYEIAQQHGGRITAECQPGQGAVFTIWLPLA